MKTCRLRLHNAEVKDSLPISVLSGWEHCASCLVMSCNELCLIHWDTDCYGLCLDGPQSLMQSYMGFFRNAKSTVCNARINGVRMNGG